MNVCVLCYFRNILTSSGNTWWPTCFANAFLFALCCLCRGGLFLWLWQFCTCPTPRQTNARLMRHKTIKDVP